MKISQNFVAFSEYMNFNFLFVLLFFAHLFFISSFLLHFALSITNKLCERLLKTYSEQTLPFYYRCQNLRIKSSRPTKDQPILGFKTKVLLTFYYTYCSIISTVWNFFPRFSVISTVQSPKLHKKSKIWWKNLAWHL